jgi:hypothetical protein
MNADLAVQGVGSTGGMDILVHVLKGFDSSAPHARMFVKLPIGVPR